MIDRNVAVAGYRGNHQFSIDQPLRKVNVVRDHSPVRPMRWMGDTASTYHFQQRLIVRLIIVRKLATNKMEQFARRVCTLHLLFAMLERCRNDHIRINNKPKRDHNLFTLRAALMT